MHYKSIDYNYIQHYSKLTHFPCPHYCIYRQTHYIIIKRQLPCPVHPVAHRAHHTHDDAPCRQRVQAGGVICLQYVRLCLLFVATSFLELALERVHTVVDSLLKGVGHLVGEQILAAGNVELH